MMGAMRGKVVAVVSDRPSKSAGARRVAIVAGAALSFTLPTAAAAGSFFDKSAGKPSAGALPEYFQMGECTLLTVEGTDPILFSESGVLFRVLSQNWNSAIGDHRRRRGADTKSYVFCSKRMPAVVDRMDVGRYMVTCLRPMRVTNTAMPTRPRWRCISSCATAERSRVISWRQAPP